MLRLRVLGGFALEGPPGAAASLLPQRRAEAALAVLAVCGDLGCTRERLIALLWPESDEAHSRHSLRDVLRAIRHAAGRDAVLSSGESLRLDPGAIASDVSSLTQLLSGGRPAEAVRHYGGPLLDGFHLDGAPEFERWLDAERTRLAREHTEALVALATAAARAGAWDEAAGWWARAVESDPLNSHFVLQQVRALAALGDRANAIKVADGHARRLREELDLEPDREMLAKIERIRRGDLLTPQDYPVRSGPGPLAPGPPTGSEPATGPERASLSGERSAPGERSGTQARSRWPGWVPWAGGAAAVVIVTLLAILVFRSRPLIVTASDLVQVTDDPGVEFEPAISPDGNDVAYVAGPIGLPRPYVRGTGNVPDGTAIRLGDSAMGSGWRPAWSADGQLVRFLNCPTGWESGCDWMESGRLGGLARRMVRDLTPRAAVAEVAWSPDGARVAYVRQDTILTSAAGDTTRQLVAVHRAGRGEPHSLAWSPDGRYIAYVNGHSGWPRGILRVAGASIWLVDAGGGEPQEVTDQDHLNVSPAWLDARHLLFVSDRDGPRGLYVVEVGPHGARGAAHPVPGVADPHSISYSIAARKLAFSKLTARQNIWSYPLGVPAPVSIRAGRRVTTGTQVIEGHDVSPDGRWIAYNGGRRGNSDLYKLPLAGGEAVALTETAQNEAQPRWSPDGRQIAFYLREPLRTLWVMSSDGGGPVRVGGGASFGSRPRWSRDGLRLVFLTGVNSQASDWQAAVVKRDSVGGPWGAPSALIDVPCWPLAVHPDGSGVLCESHQAGQLFFVSWAGRILWKREVPFDFFELAEYSRDGKTLYLEAERQGGGAGIWAIGEGGRGAVRLAVAFDDPALQGTLWLSVGPERLYLSVAELESDIWVAKLRY